MPNGLASLKVDDLQDTRRRSVLLKQTHFTKKHGRRHHGFDKEKAPYPLSYDRLAVDLDIIDHVFLKQMKQSVSFVNFEEGLPRRCLDLGCGTGAWILDALNEWPDCEFVGFDLVNIQPAPSAFTNFDASRVKWVYGNFLTTKLPFDDDEFDHVHIRGIARAVPENKWDYLLEEIHRVLRPGGSVEMIEEDILFPSLPRWYTTALRARDQKKAMVHLPDGSLRRSLPMSPPPTPPRDDAPHDHALLESLFNSVFETRFINREPTSILPSYFSTYFRQVQCSPVINFPVPPLPSIPTYNIAASRRFISPSSLASQTRSLRSHRQERSQSSTSESSVYNNSSDDDDEQLVQQRTPPSSEDESEELSKASNNSVYVQPYFSSPSDDTSIGDASALLPISALSQASSFSLALQLHRMYNLVLACQESMWEVLNDRIRNREQELKDLGWDDDDLEADHARQRFEKLLERYEGDMKTRAALWQRMVLSQSPHFKLPRQGLMSKAEMNDEDRVYRAMLEAQRKASDENSRSQCRTLRIFVGFKSQM